MDSTGNGVTVEFRPWVRSVCRPLAISSGCLALVFLSLWLVSVYVSVSYAVEKLTQYAELTPQDSGPRKTAPLAFTADPVDDALTTISPHGWQTGDPVTFHVGTGGRLPTSTPQVDKDLWYVGAVSPTTVQVFRTRADAEAGTRAVDFTDSGGAAQIASLVSILPLQADDFRVRYVRPVVGLVPSRLIALLFGADLSTVTPFLLFLFMAYIAHGSACILRNRPDLGRLRTFPFPTGFVIFWVQLGLIGTIWGFLILGIGLARQRPGDDAATITLLVQAFGTALLSTFTAVVLAYIAAPPVQRLFAKFFAQPVTESAEERSSLEFVQWMDNTTQSLRAMSEALGAGRGQLVDSLDSVTNRLEGTAQRLDAQFSAPGAHLEQLTQEVRALHSTLSALLADRRLSETAAENTRGNILKSTSALHVRLYSALWTVSSKMDEVQRQNSESHAEAQQLRKLAVSSIQGLAGETARHQAAVDAMSGEVAGLRSELQSLRQELAARQDLAESEFAQADDTRPSGRRSGIGLSGIRTWLARCAAWLSFRRRREQP